jgi:hypothetical protein
MRQEWIGRAVVVVVEGQVEERGIAEHVTADGWVGLRQADGRLDEFPGWSIEIVPA